MNLMNKFLPISLVFLGLGCGVAGDQPPATGAGQSIWNSSVSVLVAQDLGGGFVPQPPQGSSCLSGAKKFTLTVASRGLAWTRCVGSATTPYQPVSDSRVLSDTELKDLGAVLGNLRVVARTGACAADASTMTATVTNPLGTQDYVDDLSQCAVQDKPLLDRQTLTQALDRFSTLGAPVM